eukprot:11573579-Ditylum_brightwellii.AAC.1
MTTWKVEMMQMKTMMGYFHCLERKQSGRHIDMDEMSAIEEELDCLLLLENLGFDDNGEVAEGTD